MVSKNTYFGGYQSFLWGPCFELLVISALGFKARVDPLLVSISPVHKKFVRFNFGATPTGCFNTHSCESSRSHLG